MSVLTEYMKSIDIASIENAGWIAVLFVLVLLASFVVGATVNKLLSKRLPTSALFIAGACQLGIVIGGSYWLAIYSGVNPTLVLAVIAIVSAGVSLSGEQAFSSFIGGLQIVTSDRFKVGDQVTIGDVTGVVISISLLTTTIQVNTRGIVVLSNRNVAESQITNHSAIRGVELSLTFPMYDEHSISKATATIHAAIDGHEGIYEKFKILHAWDTGCEQYGVIVKVKDYGKRREVLSDLSIRITESLRKEGLPLGSVSFLKNI